MVSSPIPLSIHQLSGGAAVTFRIYSGRKKKNFDLTQDGFIIYIYIYFTTKWIGIWQVFLIQLDRNHHNDTFFSHVVCLLYMFFPPFFSTALCLCCSESRGHSLITRCLLFPPCETKSEDGATSQVWRLEKASSVSRKTARLLWPSAGKKKKENHQSYVYVSCCRTFFLFF